MIRKLLATLGILFSLMIVLAFTITLPKQDGEPTAEPWVQTATAIVVQYTELAPIYNLTETARAEARETFAPTLTNTVYSQTQVSETGTAIARDVTRTPLPIFETATQLEYDSLTSTPENCNAYADLISVRIGLDKINAQINSVLVQNNIPIHAYIEYFYTYWNPDYVSWMPDKAYDLCDNMSYRNLILQLGGDNVDEAQLSDYIGKTLVIVDQFLTSEYDAELPPAYLHITAVVYEDDFFIHRVERYADYRYAVDLLRSGVQREDLIEVLGGFYRLVYEKY